MSPIKVTLNKKNLQKNIFVDSSALIAKKIAPIVEEKIKQEQQKTVEEFLSHPVSQELSSGANASNTSGLLNGYGNLFSFIGFEKGTDPISPISEILKRRINYSIKPTNAKGGYVIIAEIPSKEEIFAETKVGWLSGKSWADGIERGLSGLNRFLYDESYEFKNSRSGSGVQVENIINSVKQNRTKYLSQILNNFKNRLSRLS